MVAAGGLPKENCGVHPPGRRDTGAEGRGVAMAICRSLSAAVTSTAGTGASRAGSVNSVTSCAGAGA